MLPPPLGEFSPALTVFPSPWPPLPALFAAAVVAAVTTGERTKREGEDMSSRIRTELRSSCFEAVVMQRATWPNVGVLKLSSRYPPGFVESSCCGGVGVGSGLAALSNTGCLNPEERLF